MTKWVLLEAARLYALPELLFSLCKYYPFSSGQISCAENRFLSGPETEIATCFPLKAPKQLNRIPVFRPHRKRKSGFPAEPETEMRALQSPRDRKRNRWRLCTSFSHQMNRKRKWWLYCLQILTGQGINFSWLSACKLSADYLSREPVGILTHSKKLHCQHPNN